MSLAVSFTLFATVIRDHLKDGQNLGYLFNADPLMMGTLLLSMVCGLIAALQAVRALLALNDYKTLNENDVFNEGILREANDVADGDEKYGLMEYKKFLITDMWMITQAQATIHRDKAEKIQIGQKFYLGFLTAYGEREQDRLPPARAGASCQACMIPRASLPPASPFRRRRGALARDARLQRADGCSSTSERGRRVPCARDRKGWPPRLPFRTQHPLGTVVNRPSV